LGVRGSPTMFYWVGKELFLEEWGLLWSGHYDDGIAMIWEWPLQT